MPAQERHKTKYVGVYYIEGSAIGTGKQEKIFYITYRKNGKLISEKAGRQYQDDMTAARASRKRERRISGKELSNAEQRAAKAAEKRAEVERYTISKLWDAYKVAKPNLKGWKTGTYNSQYNKHVKPLFGEKKPQDILPLDIKRVENKLLKTHSAQTVNHVLKLLRILCNFGADNGLCQGLSFKIKMPPVDNVKTEDLNPDQMDRLLKAIDADDHPQAGTMMKMALFTGMRRGEMFKLKWEHIDFQRGFIQIIDPKGGPDQRIPLNDASRRQFENHRIAAEQQQQRNKPPKWAFSEFVFPGRGGGQRTRIDRAVNKIKTAAKLPKNFRPLHGLRHVYASMLASSGQVDMYTLQKLLTHKDPKMTQRYAHLRDDALKKAANLAGDIISKAVNSNKKNESTK